MAEIILTGDALEQLRHLPPESVHTCVTSPPYYNLRDYGAAGQIGNEASVEEYLQSLVSVFREVRRVLRADGTMWVNMGDSYATRSGSQPPTNTRNSCGHTAKHTPRGYKYKDLIGVPWQLAFALRADGWYLRQDIIWNKSNCMPESVRDRCTKSHEYIFLLSKSERYYFDAAAISEPVTSTKGNARTFRGGGAYTGGRAHDNSAQVERESHGNRENQTGRRNKRDVWTVSTNGFRGAHFAVFPEKLIEPCILAGSPLGGTVLDPFAGSGTTGVVAKRLRRDFIGCEINHDYAQMAADRIAAATRRNCWKWPRITWHKKKSHLRPVLSTRRRWQYRRRKTVRYTYIISGSRTEYKPEKATGPRPRIAPVRVISKVTSSRKGGTHGLRS